MYPDAEHIAGTLFRLFVLTAIISFIALNSPVYDTERASASREGGHAWLASTAPASLTSTTPSAATSTAAVTVSTTTINRIVPTCRLHASAVYQEFEL